ALKSAAYDRTARRRPPFATESLRRWTRRSPIRNRGASERSAGGRGRGAERLRVRASGVRRCEDSDVRSPPRRKARKEEVAQPPSDGKGGDGPVHTEARA